jgi:putative Mn2+ efflux pump MntP
MSLLIKIPLEYRATLMLSISALIMSISIAVSMAFYVVEGSYAGLINFGLFGFCISALAFNIGKRMFDYRDSLL